MEKVISVISWDEVLKNLPDDNPNKELCDIITTLCKDLKKENKDYVYRINLEFGDKIIDKGSRFLYEDNNYSIKNEYENVTKTILDFKNDLSYSHDPLGMVIKNHIEVYSENQILKNNSPLRKYRVHLNTIKQCSFFGLYGTLDYLNNNSSSDNMDWYTIAGNSCFEILFPFHTDGTMSKVKTNKNPNKEFINKLISSECENKSIFFKKYINKVDKGWRTEIIYFPKHYIDRSDSDFKINLFNIGWSQSSSARNFLFENKNISKIIDSVDNVYSLKNNKHLLTFILDYLIKSINGEAYVLKPLENSSHILNLVLEEFKNDIQEYLKSTKYCTPIILHYDTISNNEWGCLAIDSIPILLNYPRINLNHLEEDLRSIVNSENEISFPSFYTTADSGSGNDRYNGRKHLINKIKSSLEIKKGEISLTNIWLSNFLVINDKI